MQLDKIEILAAEFSARGRGYFTGEPGQSLSIYEKATGQHISISSENKFMVILTEGLLTNPYLVVGQGDHEVLTVSWPKGVVLQSDDVFDVLNIFYGEKKYIHHIYQDLEFPFFFLKIGMLFSPELYNSVRKDPAKNIYDYSISQLTHSIHGKRLGLVSSRARDYAVHAAFLREHPAAMLTDRDNILKNSDLELDFEKVRKEKFNWAPSRLSAFYLMSDSEYDRWNLGDMFRKQDRRSIVVQLKTTHLMSMVKVDYRWMEAYHHQKDSSYIENYWSSGYSEKSLPVFPL